MKFLDCLDGEHAIVAFSFWEEIRIVLIEVVGVSEKLILCKVEPVEQARAARGELLLELLVNLEGLLDKEAFNLVVWRSNLRVVTNLVRVQDQIEVKDESWEELDWNESTVVLNDLDGELLTLQRGWKNRELDLVDIVT